VAHDLNSIVSAMLMHFALLRQDGRLATDVKDLLKEMEGEMRRVAQLSRQLCLPREEAEAPGDADSKRETISANPRSGNEVKGGSETILLVEDEAALRRVVALGFRKLGYAVLIATDGREALELWEKHQGRIDLLFTDVILPGEMDGIALAKRLKGEKADLKIIMTSGCKNKIEKSLLSGELGIIHVVKPYDVAEIAVMARSCLNETIDLA